MKIRTKASMLLTTLGLFSTTLMFGQTTIPNGDFENWQSIGTADEEPTNWSGNKTGSGFANLGPQTCFRESSNPHTGSYCLKLDNGSFFGTPINATATTGRIEAPSSNPTDGYINTLTTNADHNTPFTGRPDSLVGWFRFDQGGTDVGRIQAILHDNFNVSNPDQGGSAAHIISEAAFDLPNGNTAAWTRFAVPFNYNNGSTPEYILLIATASSTIGSANSSTILWVDDLSVVYCTPTAATLNEVVCGTYTAPSGAVFTTSGTYQDTLNAGSNCERSYTINLTVNTVDTSVTASGSMLMANATGATYQWVDCNNGNAPIVGETNSTFTPISNGNYAVEVTENSCTMLSSCYNFVISNVNTLDFSHNLAIYPNPTTGAFTIELGAAYAHLAISITDINGKIVYQTTADQMDVVHLDLDQPAGVYFVSLISETKHTVVKLMKQ
ncbi:MAG: Unknown protein [uncultured Aureispira sp.]|uniref:Secretion system C-terminal sorting domain-containing protein n=1 Tax=uncultured Aureispira sp. TaxID=1331704 RepID=A0A6S6UCN1_9BACT|nr:MAG: Unknown protein [uncultured Aureispira sp.]